MASVCPPFKNGDPCNAWNYRPISPLPIISKLLEKVVHRQLVKHLQLSFNGPGLPAEQFAYRSNHSCEDALALIINNWQVMLDEGSFCGVVFADMSKAFDRVQHSTVIQDLHELGVSGIPLKWFCSYLSSHFQRLTTAVTTAENIRCSREVPQWTGLGPLLFCVYIRGLPAQFRHSISQLYADDIAFYKKSRNIVKLCADLTVDLNILDEYLSTRGLLLNPKKTQFLVVHKTSVWHQIPSACHLFCRDVTIDRVQSATYLGVVIDEHLTFSSQVDQVIRKVDAKSGAVRHGRQNLTFSANLTFYLSVIQPSIDYASSAHVHLVTSAQCHPLVVTSHWGMKKVFGLDRKTPTRIVLQHTRLYPVEYHFNLKLYVVYRCLHNLASHLICKIFVRREDATHTVAEARGQIMDTLALLTVKSRFGYHSIAYLAATRWNSLPSHWRVAESSTNFIHSTKLFLGFPVIS